MVYDESVADWVLLVGKGPTRVGLSDFVVRKFAEKSMRFRQLMEDAAARGTHQIPMPDLRRFTSKMEYYLGEGAHYDDHPSIYFHVHPERPAAHKFLAGIAPQLPYALALERCAIDVEMFTLGAQYGMEPLCRLALRKLQAALPAALESPALAILLLAAARAPRGACAATIASETRRALKTRALPPREWARIKRDLERNLERLQVRRPPGWQRDEACLLQYMFAVEGNERLRGFTPVAEDEGKKRRGSCGLLRSFWF